MSVLVLDTALGVCTAAVFADGVALAIRSEAMTRGHAERLAGFARDAVAAAGGGFEALDRIGVTVGPGSFTGLRVGLAFAQGLGAALDRPVVGISTLQALAASAPGGPAGPIAAVIDARRGEVYLQRFADGAPLGPPEALDVDAARGRLDDADWTLVGSGAGLLFPDRASAVLDPAPGALAGLTASLDPVSHPPRPVYLRAPDAVPPTRLPGQPRPVGTALR
ncbi:tRNA (adenosine(37)-N6)-threonylcarbamoyltransferase complex dimerization subunit type 1 TsaB [Brevundimonas sp. LM2]|uniref:tRNA (adenosine(37)-N6)-threonylcarbamoyltransferase complex dimerization subunit type 1 TsaB n=1 Tax=Brevundimonas sp. LM2 TaxID=1938605 RepID=UPI000983B7F5|nr:tRNA (adenosine(37)-N6)-threonylcarbamoyltransferase complex dimerization subunit type 1 TsaB [Brevundimonas sp. LM2]AQR60450.1 tRNA (adenosine(37)-N6)-threonylcarbamoyltransferase complex dimerization subunit type 1 TsaB [Brevundimonas sp. LM2]